MKTFDELVPIINDWFEQKNLNNILKQKLKFIEEFGELTGAYLKNNEPLKKDGLGKGDYVYLQCSLPCVGNLQRSQTLNQLISVFLFIPILLIINYSKMTNDQRHRPMWKHIMPYA